jgi:HEAT repeat protein
MNFYSLNKEKRKQLVDKINSEINLDLKAQKNKQILKYFADEDTYVRKAAYIAMGRIYKNDLPCRPEIIQQLDLLLKSPDAKVRQTVINVAGETGIISFPEIAHLMETGLIDKHHSVRNAVIGAMKKMGEKNPVSVLAFSKRFLHHDDKEVRREICHGLELYGRTHPEDILPLLKELEHDNTALVRNMVIHVIGQISYKKGCLEKVIEYLKTWENTELVKKAVDEIIEVHDRYKNFAFYTQKQAVKYIQKHFA